MSNSGFNELVKIVLENSHSKVWDKAVKEWCVWGQTRRDYPDGTCLCGYHGIRLEYSIANKVTGACLGPIGSTCIKKFDDLNWDDDEISLVAEVDTLRQARELLDAMQKYDLSEFVPITSDWFSRKLILFFYENDAFEPTKYNHYDPERDYQFLIDMFNKRNEPTLRQQKRTYMLLKNYVKPCLYRVFEEAEKRHRDVIGENMAAAEDLSKEERLAAVRHALFG